MHGMKGMSREAARKVRNRVKLGGIVVLLLLAMGAIATYMDYPGVKLGLIIASGGWDPDSALVKESGRLWQTVAATLAVFLNTGLLVAVGGLAYSYLKRDRVTLMYVSKAIAVKELAIKQALFQALAQDEETVRRINEAFAQGDRDWAPTLAALTSSEEAEKIIHAMNAIDTRINAD